MSKAGKWVGVLATITLTGLAVGVSGGLAATYGGDHVRPVFSRELPNVPGKMLAVAEVNYEPGGATKPHHHAGVVFAYVVSGQIRSQVDDGPARVYKAGESFFEEPGSHHVISENASATEPAKLLAVIIADKGAEMTTMDK